MHQHSNRTEPSFREALGSSVPFFASVFALSGEANWSATRENRTKSGAYRQDRVDTVTSGKEKAREHREPELGQEAGRSGFERSDRREESASTLRCGGGRRLVVAGAVRVETSRIGGDRR